MRKINSLQIGEKIYQMLSQIGYKTTSEAYSALKKAYDNESVENSKFALEVLLDNLKIAEEKKMPICQDTGMCVVVLEIGQENFGDNTPAMINTEIVKGDKVSITVLQKGFGSENMSKIFMLKPSADKDQIIDCVVKTVLEAGSNPCPPIVLGVGIGGTFDKCAYISKKALLRPIGSKNPRKDVSELEDKIQEKINSLKIGAMGFKGVTTSLATHVEILPTHIAGLPVAVNVQCHAVRVKKEVI